MQASTRVEQGIVLRAATVGMICLPAAATWAEDALPVGIVSEPRTVTLLLRIAAVVWGAGLLAGGVRRPGATSMSFFLCLGLAIGLLAGGDTSYLVALAITFAIVVAAAMMVVWLRRAAMALACAWPLPAAYAASLYFSGSFERSLPVAIGLALAGATLGALWLRGGTALLASSLGTILLLTALPGQPGPWLVFGLAIGSMLWQLLLLDRLWKTPFDDIPSWPEHERRQPRKFMATVKTSSAFLAGLVAVVVVTAPQYGPGAGARAERVGRLIEGGELTRPSLVLSRGDNLYLSGRSTPIAILAPEPGLISRLALPLIGRSSSAAIRRMRAVKDADELEKMRRAAAVTSQAFVDIAPMIRPGVSEGEVAEAIAASFRRNGATGIAFDSIVGSGKNATLPHYDSNKATMTGGLVVIDIGCSVDGYASDMTRTFPVTGSMTDQQQELVDVVNAAGDAARSLLRAGVTTRELDRAARKVIDDAGYGPFFLHGLGHHVGLAVHDPHAGTLEPGMVITIEPGIYISAGSEIDPAYWDLGVRIEDSYIVTGDGYEEITAFPR